MARRFFAVFCLIVIFFQLSQILYFQQSQFFSSYSISYWKDRYEHSQYQLPLSKRIIGDDGLYAYSGYKVIQGADPFSINVDKPPVGKYLIGLSVFLFKNPIYISFFLGICILIIFYLIAKKIVEDHTSVLFGVTILSLEPFFFTQLYKSWYDIIQLFFLLLNILAIVYIENFKKNAWLLLLISGTALGLFFQTKPAVLFPVIFLLETLYVLLKNTKLGYSIFLLGISIGFLFPYARFIQLNHSFIDVLRIQKYMASFYLQSNLKTHSEAIWQMITTGYFPDIVTRASTKVSEWWVFLPVSIFLGFGTSFFLLFKKNTSIFFRGFSVLVLASLIIYTFIPSYPRYIIIVLPFFYLFSIKAISYIKNKKVKFFIFFGVLTYGIINSTLQLLPNPNASLDIFYYNFSHQYFQDVYEENITEKDKQVMDRTKFRYVAKSALENANIKEIEISEKERVVPKFGNQGQVRATITYKTLDLGNFSQEKTINLAKENNVWRVKWKWDLIFDGFLPEYLVETKLDVGRRGSILDLEGHVMAKDVPLYLVLVNPQEVNTQKEEEMLKVINAYVGKGYNELYNGYAENSLPDKLYSLITLHTQISEKEKIKLLSYKGLILTEYPSRLYTGLDSLSLENTNYYECCTRIYSSYNYHGVKGPEKEFDSILFGYSGGTIQIKDKNGKVIRTVYKKEKKDGRDAIIGI